ncbi:MAG: hypothetical protein JNK02_07515 [Planctomycetes bacterium]|nr:hypothetical protein [Planctomycetota bacterium]
MGATRGFRPIESLARAARNSPWILIAAAAHVLVLAGAAIFVTAYEPPLKVEVPTIVRLTERPPAEEAIPEPQIVRAPIPKLDPTELASEPVDVWIADTPVPEDLTLEVGDPLGRDLGGGGGSSAIGVGPAGRVGSGPSPFPSRGPGKGPAPGRRGPEVDRTQEAVLQGLRWLARHQNEDGSWSAATLNDVCPCDDPAYRPKKPYPRIYDTGTTSLALLAFLGAGHTHLSRVDLVDTTRGRRHRIGEIVKKGLQWLVARQNPDGSVTPERAFLYNEALAAMALSEAYGLSQARYFREPAQRAIDGLQRAQRPAPSGTGLWGWRYASREDVERFHRGAGSRDADLARELYDADTSVTAWAVLALKSGQISGLTVAPESLSGAVAFTEHVIQRGPDGRPTGLAGYLDARTAGLKVTGPNDHFEYHPGAMSALAMCIRIFAGRDADDPFLRPAADQVVKDPPRVSKDGLSIDYYAWYYGSLALNQFDGPAAPRRTGRHWPAWDKAVVEALLALQSQDRRSCASGGWMAPDRWSLDHGGPLYATALNVLTLEVYYRYENAFGGAKRN